MRERLTDPVFLTRLFVVGGLVLRLWHYALDHVIWYDEAVLLDNVLGKSFGELLGPTRNEVAAPPLYLWMLKAIHLLFGDVSYLWRLPSLLAGCGMLVLTVPLARAVLTPHGAAFAVGLVAVSDDHVRLCNTVKPYTLDALLATALLYGLVRTADWPTARRLAALAVLAPFVLCLSYPMAFVAGAVLLALWPANRREAAAWLLAALAIAVTFALLYFGPIRAQKVDKLENEWERYYLPLAEPSRLPGWLAWNWFGVFQYVCNPSGAALAVLAPFGWLAYWRSRHRRLAVALAATFAAVLAASAIRSYPFGQHRLMQFITPVVVLLGARGIEVLAGWRRWAGVGLAVAVVCVADGLSLWRMAVPWRSPDARSVRNVVRERRSPGEPVLSDEGNYLYFFHGELRPLSAAADVPVGRRVWAVMDHHTPEVRREYLDGRLRPLGFELVSADEFDLAGAYLYERTR